MMDEKWKTNNKISAVGMQIHWRPQGKRDENGRPELAHPN
jgi:hypothetical protein